jgi:hypothetical protein
MARDDVRALYRELRVTRFGFLPLSEYALGDLYATVRPECPALCDDGLLCADTCISGHAQAEWKRVLRKALHALNGPAGPVGPGSVRGSGCPASAGVARALRTVRGAIARARRPSG